MTETKHGGQRKGAGPPRNMVGGAYLLPALKAVKITKAEQEKYHKIQQKIVGSW